MGLDVVDGVSWADQAYSKAVLAQWLLRQLTASTSPPSSIVVGATAGVAALASALTVETGEGIGAHGADAGTDAEFTKGSTAIARPYTAIEPRAASPPI
jgi:hypothetical protein